MESRRRVVFVSIGIAALAWAAPTAAQELKPFSEVKEVCPTCPQVGYDDIVLTDGKTIYAVVVAENPQFYVLRKYGELRAVGRDRVKTIRRKSTESHSGYNDQILTTDGLVLAGKIVRERADTGMYEIRMPPNQVSVFVYKPFIQVIFEGGKKVFEGRKPRRG